MEVQDAQGLALMDVRRGMCFVGCNLQVRMPDGTKCRGFAVGLNYDYPLGANISCPGMPTAVLQVETVSRDGPSTGTLVPDASLFSDALIDIDAIVARHAPSPET